MFVKKNAGILIVFSLIGLFALYRALQESYEEKVLKEYALTKGVLTKITGAGIRSQDGGIYRYYVKGVKYTYEQAGVYLGELQIGDTMLIKYSTKDPSVARVVDKYYMKKYQNRKTKNQ